MSERIIIHHLSHALYRWAYDYHNAVNDMIDKDPGVSNFAVKYNNACLAFELVIKSHIAYDQRSSSPKELEDILSKKFGHSIKKMTKYCNDIINVPIGADAEKKLKLVDKFYASHMFRYPPYDPFKVELDHQKLMEAINELRRITAILLVMIYVKTDGYAIGKEKI